MKQLELTPLNIQRAMSLLDVQHHLDDDLVITNFDTVPLPEECRRTECTIVVLCTAGMGRYTLGTVEHTLKTNDVLIAGAQGSYRLQPTVPPYVFDNEGFRPSGRFEVCGTETVTAFKALFRVGGETF